MNLNVVKEVCLSSYQEYSSDPEVSCRWSRDSGVGALLLAIAFFVISPLSALGQSIPTTNKGWLGLNSGTQPPAGIYVSALLWNYKFDTLKTNDGTAIGGRGIASVDQVVPAMVFTYVS